MAGNNFYFVFAGLLMLLAVEPFLEGTQRSDVLIQLAFTSMMVVGVLGLAADARAFRLGLGVGAIGLAAAVGFYVTDSRVLQLIDLTAIAVFCLLAIAVQLRTVLVLPGPITSNRLVGALCIYLLLGVLWATLYAVVELFDPAAFLLIGGKAKAPLEHFLYYSFVTLTTVGYGDMTPLHPVARTLSYFEAVIGQLYLAVLIASLIGRYAAGQRSQVEV